MLNCHKTYRESMDKYKKSHNPKKQPTINRSHTSSINLKMTQDLQLYKHSLKKNKQNNDPVAVRDIMNHHNKSKSNLKNQTAFIANNPLKYSFKIKQDNDYYDGNRVRIKTNYDQTSSIKPLKDTSRCLITDRNPPTSDYKNSQKSLTKRRNSHLKTQYKQNQEYNNLIKIDLSTKYDKNEIMNNKQVMTRHSAQMINSQSSQGQQMVKIPLSQLKKMYEQYKIYENEVNQLQKQLSFYRKNPTKNIKNSVLLALAE